MKKTIFIAFFAFSVQSIFAQNPNPFKSIGKPAPEFLSLTNGKYPEIFENDTLRKIGSVMFNTRTNKIEYFIEKDTMYSEATLQPEIVSRWLSIDPLARKYPFVSPYNFVNNNPILLIDSDGREWVNPYQKKANNFAQQALDNPNDKDIARKARYYGRLAARSDALIAEIQTNDKALYSYIDNLKVTLNGKGKNVKVFVYVTDGISGKNGQVGQTEYRKSGDMPNVKYGNKRIVAPITKGELTVDSDDRKKNEIGFSVTIWDGPSFSDGRLANEAGDIMYYMEYNENAVKEPSNAEYFKQGKGGFDAYNNSGSGSYSKNVESKYLERKKSGKGKNEENNPYPLKK